VNAPSILVVRADDDFAASLRSAGFDVTNLPLIETRRLTDQDNFMEMIARIDQYDGIFFTSPMAAEVYVQASEPRTDGPKLYVMGGRSAEILERAGYSVQQHEGANTAVEFISSFDKSEFHGKKLLFVRGDRSLLTIPTLLKDRSEIEEVIVYETVDVTPEPEVLEQIKERLRTVGFDWICFFSPSGVESFCKLFGKTQGVKVAVIGTTTAGAAEKLGLTVNLVSPRSSAQAFSLALANHINGN
jgi:uroporphyrinogen-III synthase